MSRQLYVTKRISCLLIIDLQQRMLGGKTTEQTMEWIWIWLPVLIGFILYSTPFSEGTVEVGQDFLCNILYFYIKNKPDNLTSVHILNVLFIQSFFTCFIV